MTDNPKTTPPDHECDMCGGDGVLPIFRYAIAPGGPDTLPCPFCHPEDNADAE